MSKIHANALFFSNSNIELAYKVKKIAWEMGVNVINCQTSTELIMHNFQIKPEIIFFDLTSDYCTMEFIFNFCKNGFYFVPNIVVIGKEKIEFEHDNYVLFVNELDFEKKFIDNFHQIRFSILSNKVKRFSEATINNYLLESLKPLSVNKSHKGYKYLKDIVKFLCINDGVHFKLTKLIYPAIAARNNVSPCSVERDVRTVVHHIWKFSKKENLYDYFGDYNNKKAPTNLQLISALVEKTLCYCMLNS